MGVAGRCRATLHGGLRGYFRVGCLELLVEVRIASGVARHGDLHVGRRGNSGVADRRRAGGKKLLRRLTLGAARAQTSVEGCRLLVKRTMPRESYRSPDEPNGIARTSKFAESTFH